MRRLLPIVCLIIATTGCGSNSSPTTPTPPPPAATPTRIIQLDATLTFGDVNIGATFERTLRISNNGTATLTVSSLSTNTGGGYVADWTSGTIAPATSRVVTIQFRPTEHRSYSGSVTVNADQTSGTNTIPISGMGLAPIWRLSGVGDTVFDMPLYVARVHIIGTYSGSCSNFIARITGRPSLVNEILGTCSIGIGPRYDGTVLTGGGGVVSITSSTGVNWSFEEVR